jgi:protein involved in polysaccharide export with SLBB domain
MLITKKYRQILQACFLIIILAVSIGSLSAQTRQQNQAQDTSATSIANQRKLVSGAGATNQTSSDTLSLEERKLFGYSVFHNNNISFAPNLNMATPKNYVVGPGDVLTVQVYGVAQSTYTLIVSNEGKVNIESIGVVNLSGLTIEAAKTALMRKMAIRYAGMNGPNPVTFLDVTLAEIRNIKVNMVGEIQKPGTYTLPSYVTVFNALFAAGGPTVKGTFRHVQVYRGNKMVSEIDLYDFLVGGRTNANIRLEDNDVVLIRPAETKVEIIGEVRTAGIFELKSSETLKDLLKYAAGFSEKAYKEIVQIQRTGQIDLEAVDVTAKNFNSFRMMNGDVVNVGPIRDRFKNRVQITGAVTRPGAYELVDGMSVQDLIQIAGGLLGDAYTPKALVYRTKEDLSQEVISVNLADMADTKSTLLKREDVLQISSQYGLREQFYVQISGEVNRPGIFTYSDSLTVSDLILRSGGFKYSASESSIEIVRRVLNDPSKVADIITVNVNRNLIDRNDSAVIHLKPFDHVFIRNIPGFQEQKLITVSGEVNYSGTFAIDKKEMKISDVLKRAGGLTSFAYPRGATLLRRTKNFKELTPTEKENESLTRLVQEITKDPILYNSESNREYVKRLNEKINANNKLVAKEKEEIVKEEKKEELLKENANVLNAPENNTRVVQEKEQNLVAIDLEAILKNPGSPADLVLKDGDVLNIPEKLETVSVRGGVLYPVSVRFENGLHFKQYISRAGGYDPKALRDNAYVLQANGKVERVRNWLFFKKYPKVEPGAEIFVPARTTEKPPFNYTQTVQLITSFVTSTLTLILVLRTL